MGPAGRSLLEHLHGTPPTIDWTGFSAVAALASDPAIAFRRALRILRDDRALIYERQVRTMRVIKPRSCMISVRLSEEEYESLQQLCTATGTRSVSELTRYAMRLLLNNPSQENLLSGTLDEFRVQITTLDRLIQELSERVASTRTEREGRRS